MRAWLPKIFPTSKINPILLDSVISGRKGFFYKKGKKEKHPSLQEVLEINRRLKKEHDFKGVYSSFGYNGGKLAYLFGCEVWFPNGNSENKHKYTQNKVRSFKLPKPINLGCKKKYISKESLNYNSENTADKLRCFNNFKDSKIPFPRLLTREEIINGDASSLPKCFIGRKNFSHSGRGMVKYLTSNYNGYSAIIMGYKTTCRKKKLPEHDFFVEFLSCKKEYRIHIFRGNVILELKKNIPKESSQKNYIHTLEQGFSMSPCYIEHEKRNEILFYAVKAIEACELDFGAVDIFIDINDNIYVLEVNSDPGMPGVIGYVYYLEFCKLFGIKPTSDWYIDKEFNVVKKTGKKANTEKKKESNTHYPPTYYSPSFILLI